MLVAFSVMWSLMGPAYRQSENHYAIPGAGVFETADCTVSANGELTAKVTHDWIHFYDRNGELEATCERLHTKRPVVVREDLTIHRAIATR